MLRRRLAGYRVVLAGTGEARYVMALKERARQLGVDSLVEFVGEVSGARKWEMYRSADFFVLPTRTENFGMVVAESLAVGTPVVTTQGAPWPQIAADGCGRWVPVSAQGIADGMEAMLAVPDEEREAMGRRGRKMIEDGFSAEHVAVMMCRQYEHILSDKRV